MDTHTHTIHKSHNPSTFDFSNIWATKGKTSSSHAPTPNSNCTLSQNNNIDTCLQKKTNWPSTIHIGLDHTNWAL